jgi:hypothetical protein
MKQKAIMAPAPRRSVSLRLETLTAPPFSLKAMICNVYYVKGKTISNYLVVIFKEKLTMAAEHSDAFGQPIKLDDKVIYNGGRTFGGSFRYIYQVHKITAKRVFLVGIKGDDSEFHAEPNRCLVVNKLLDKDEDYRV